MALPGSLHEAIMRWLSALFLLILSAAAPSSIAWAADVIWPDLPKTCFVKGRPATAADVRLHCAVFVPMSEGRAIGKPLPIAIPQYAYHLNKKTGHKTPVIVVQAESAMGMKMVGMRIVGTKQSMVDTLDSLQLLGTEKPH
jgi:hypothetical protein